MLSRDVQSCHFPVGAAYHRAAIDGRMSCSEGIVNAFIIVCSIGPECYFSGIKTFFCNALYSFLV